MQSYLMHYGIKGMRWGYRRYQNDDGTLTELGKKRYGSEGKRSTFGTQMDLNRLDNEYTDSSNRAVQYSRLAKSRRGEAEYAESLGQDKKSQKKRAQADQFEFYSKRHEEISEHGKDFIEKIIEKTLKEGKSVYSTDVWKSVGLGETWLERIKLDPEWNFAVGTRYTVKDDGKGIRKHTDTIDKNRKRKVTYYYY